MKLILNINTKSGDGLELLAIDDRFIIGSSKSNIKKVIAIIVAIIVILFGVFLFLIGAAFHIQYFKIYKKTGKLPELPNTVLEMKKGLKYLFGLK